MNQKRPYKSESVKNLEQTFKDFEFNKKVLSAMRAELLLRSTKSAKVLLERVDKQLVEIVRRDSFSRVAPKAPQKTSTQTHASMQMPLIPPVPAAVKIPHAENAPVHHPAPNDIAAIRKRTSATEKFISYCVIAFAIVVFRSERAHSPRSQNTSLPVSANQEVNPSPIYTRPKESPVAAHESDDWLKYTDKGYTPEKPREAQLPPLTIDTKRIETYRETVRNLLH